MSDDGTSNDDVQFSYASLNEMLLKRSLTHALQKKQWRCAAIIALGWLINWALYTAMLCVFVVYCCVLLAVENAGDAQRAFLTSWLWSVAFRFALQEPAIITCSFCIPLLFATECLTNLCGETLATVLSVAFETLIVFLSKLAHPS